jgi:hypothetical protein
VNINPTSAEQKLDDVKRVSIKQKEPRKAVSPGLDAYLSLSTVYARVILVEVVIAPVAVGVQIIVLKNKSLK